MSNPGADVCPQDTAGVAERGNMTVLRVFAVGLVIYGNGLLLTGGAPTAYWGAPTSRIGLDLLFAVSGYLALDSWLRRPGVRGFAMRRAVRLLPALVVCVGATVAVVGPLATSLGLRGYVLNGLTWRYVANVVLIPSLWLPGVFVGQQWSGTVNPMLWTLGAGVALWATIPLFGSVRHRAAALVALAGCCMAAVLVFGAGPTSHPLRDRLFDIALEAPFFLLAACYRQMEVRWPGLWRADLALVLFAANWICATWLGAEDLTLEWVSLPYMAIAFGRMSAPVLGRAGRFGNPSYGLFLYAFPLQQLIVARAPGLAYPVAACAALSLAAGYLSWHLVERPAILLAQRLRAGQRFAAPDPRTAVASPP